MYENNTVDNWIFLIFPVFRGRGIHAIYSSGVRQSPQPNFYVKVRGIVCLTDMYVWLTCLFDWHVCLTDVYVDWRVCLTDMSVYVCLTDMYIWLTCLFDWYVCLTDMYVWLTYLFDWHVCLTDMFVWLTFYLLITYWWMNSVTDH